MFRIRPRRLAKLIIGIQRVTDCVVSVTALQKKPMVTIEFCAHKISEDFI